MSKENMKKFYDALAQDAALAGELDERIAKATLEFAAEKGFEFTAEEAAAAAQEATDELSDEELDNVNGGRIRFKPAKWWEKMKEGNKKATGGAVPHERGASGSW